MRLVNELPPGWDSEHVRRTIDHYESQTEEELAAEIEGAFESRSHIVLISPNELLPAVGTLLSEASTTRWPAHYQGSGDRSRSLERLSCEIRTGVCLA